MSLRLRLGLWTSALLVTVVVLGGLLFYWNEHRLLEEKAAAGRETLFHQFAQSCRDALSVHDELAAVNAARAVATTPGVREAYCVDADGRIAAHSDPTRRGAAAPARSAAVDEGVARETDFPLVGGRGRAVLAFSTAALDRARDDDLRGLVRRAWSMFGAALALGLLAAALIARGLTRPLEEIARGTRAVAEGRWSHRLALRRRDEIGRLAEDFNEMARRLGELDQMKEDFVANVTHELRSPLSAIESYTNLIERELRRGHTAPLADYLAIVRNNATRLGRFINDVLDLAKIAAGGDEVHWEDVDARAALTEVAELFAPRAEEKSVALRLGDLPATARLRADPDKLHQVLTNLVGNALKFTPAGGRVILDAVRDGGRTILRVADSGPGVPPADRARIFNRFEQVKDARGRVEGPKGTGLGLAITKGLVEAQRGTIDVGDAPGGGALFRVSLEAVG